MLTLYGGFSENVGKDRNPLKLLVNFIAILVWKLEIS